MFSGITPVHVVGEEGGITGCIQRKYLVNLRENKIAITKHITVICKHEYQSTKMYETVVRKYIKDSYIIG
jgi:hypothetical protein